MCHYVYNFWYTKKILVPNKDLVVIAIHHLEISFVSIYSKTILFYQNTLYCLYNHVLNKSCGQIIVCRRLQPPSLKTTTRSPSIWATLPLYFFPEFPIFDNIFLKIFPNEMGNKHKNKIIRKNYFFMFRRLQNSFTCFF